MFKIADRCEHCGREADVLSFVGGDWWCRNCLWETFYDWHHGVTYCIARQEDFCEAYPEGYDWLRRFLKDGTNQGENHVEEFISENLEDFADWCMENPILVPFVPVNPWLNENESGEKNNE